MVLDVDKKYLKERQYKSSGNLEARIAIHQKFRTNPESFHKWIWNNLKIDKPIKVLEVGCGTGQFWIENYSSLPENSHLTLTDFSEGMIEKISSKLASKVDLVHKMTNYHLKTGGKKLRALLTLESAKLCGYSRGSRDINLAACVELIHAATLMHDDVIDNADIRRGKKTLNKVWGNQSSILVGDYLLSRCFEMMVEDGNLEVLKLLSSTSSKIAQGEVLQPVSYTHLTLPTIA